MGYIRIIYFISILFSVLGGAWFAAILRYGFNVNHLAINAWPIAIATIVFSLFFNYSNLYKLDRAIDLFDRYYKILICWAGTIISLIVLGFLFKAGQEYSRLWVAYWSAATLILLFITDAISMFFLRHLRAKGAFHSKAVILGANQLGAKVLQSLHESYWSGIDVVAYFDDDQSRSGELFNDVEIMGGLDMLPDYLRQNKIDEVWIALTMAEEVRIKEVLDNIRHSTVTIRYVPDIFEFNLLNHNVSEISGLPVINISQTPMMGINRLVKAVEDRLLAFIILLFSIPFCLLIAIVIKLTSPGPVVYKQIRHGWDGKPIKVYKFRTMDIHSDKEGSVTQATKDDSRVTVFGRLLRVTSLDELPQFLNVLQGRMSIVGPRPHAVEHNEEYKEKVDKYMLRHKVKPGITGWAQINGWRGETDTLEKMQKRVEYDLYYIENWSLWFDLKIIFLTFFKGFIHKNAY